MVKPDTALRRGDVAIRVTLASLGYDGMQTSSFEICARAVEQHAGGHVVATFTVDGAERQQVLAPGQFRWLS